MKLVWFVLALFSCSMAEELKWKLEGCNPIREWKFDPAGNDDLEIRAIEYLAKQPNNIDFKVWVKNGSGKKLCKAVKKHDMKPSKEGVIKVKCGNEKTPYVFGTSVYIEFPKGETLDVCSTKIVVEGNVKRTCPANAKEVSYGNCECKDGYGVKDGACVKSSCPANSHKDKDGYCNCNKGYTVKNGACAKVTCPPNSSMGKDGNCECNKGYAVKGQNCQKVQQPCPSNSRRVGNKCKCNAGYDTIGGKCYTKCPSHSSRHGTSCKCNSGYDMKGSSCVKKATGCQPTGGYTTLAVNAGTARQATTAYGSGGAPGRALDSNTGGHWSRNTCTHTLHYKEKNNKQIPWWSVELTQKAEVQAVEIQNRIDCCAHRLTNFRIMVDNQQCLYHQGSFNNRKTFRCTKPVIGKKITIKLATNREPLTLCDVKIKGRRITGGACGSTKCPSNSSRHGTSCKCNSGYDMKGSSCVKKATGCQPTGGYTTLAVNAGTARQATTAYGSGGAPGRALDGNTGGHWSRNTCTHTLHYKEKNNKLIPWWSVELTQKAEVQAVEIQNRIDCCAHRLTNFRIMVDNQQCLYHQGSFNNRKTLRCTKPVIGKKITIKLATNREPLTLCDVRIKGRRLTGGSCGGGASGASGACSPKGGNRHLAVNAGTARQATTAYGSGGAPGRALDGNTGGHWSRNTCTHTLHYKEKNNKLIPWWSVELRQPGLVKGLQIQNRIDCCAHRLTNFSIRVDGKLCKYHAGSFNNRRTIYCDRPVCGKKIEIKLSTNREPLTLCDVRVIGA